MSTLSADTNKSENLIQITIDCSRLPSMSVLLQRSFLELDGLKCTSRDEASAAAEPRPGAGAGAKDAGAALPCPGVQPHGATRRSE